MSATLLCWASGFVAVRAAVVAWEPGPLALGRFAVASLVLGAIAFRNGVPRVPARDWPGIAGVALLSVVVYHLALNRGQRTVGAGAASVLVNTSPVFASILAVYFLKERLSARTMAGIGVSFCGALLIALGEGKAFRLNSGVLLVLLASLAWSFNIILQKHFLARYGALQFTTLAIWVGTVFLLPFAPGLIRTFPAAPLDTTLAVVFLGVFTSAIAYACYAYVLSRLPASRASSFLLVVPALSFVIAWLYLGEIPTFTTIGGGALAIAGVVVVNTGHRIQPAEPAT